MSVVHTDGIPAAGQGLNGGHAACDGQRKGVVVCVEAVDAAQPREDGSVRGVDVESPGEEGISSEYTSLVLTGLVGFTRRG